MHYYALQERKMQLHTGRSAVAYGMQRITYGTERYYIRRNYMNRDAP